MKYRLRHEVSHKNFGRSNCFVFANLYFTFFLMQIYLIWYKFHSKTVAKGAFDF